MSTSSIFRWRGGAAFGALLLASLGGCSPKEQTPAPTEHSASPTAPAASVGPAVATLGPLTIHDPVAHPPLPGQTTGVAFMVLRNGGPEADRLVGASSPASNPVELHSHEMADGMMKMRKVDAIEVPAGGDVALSPSGYHLMLFNFAPQGNVARITLQFEKAGVVDVAVPVRDRSGNR